MNDRLDVYQQWLGIPPEEQPPDFYRLLGLARWESDAQLVSAAAQRRLAKVKQKATRQHLAVAQKLVRQIVRARATLMDARLRSEYNQRLQRAIRGAAAAPPSSGSLPAEDTLILPGTPTRGTYAGKRRKVGRGYGFFLPLCLFVCVVGLGMALAWQLPHMIHKPKNDWLPKTSQPLGPLGVQDRSVLHSEKSLPPADAGRTPRHPAVEPKREPVELKTATPPAVAKRAEVPASATTRKPDRDTGPMPAPHSSARSPEDQPGNGPAASRTGQPSWNLPQTTGKDPLRDALSPDDVPDDVFRSADDETPDEMSSESNEHVDQRPSQPAGGDAHR